MVLRDQNTPVVGNYELDLDLTAHGGACSSACGSTSRGGAVCRHLHAGRCAKPGKAQLLVHPGVLQCDRRLTTRSMAPALVTQTPIVQPPTDEKQYRHITLTNELQALLIHDPAVAVTTPDTGSHPPSGMLLHCC